LSWIKKTYYIKVRSEKIYVEKGLFDVFNRIRRKQSYSNNKYRANTISLKENDEFDLVFFVEEEAVKNVLVEQLLDAVAGLSERDKALIQAYYFEGKTERQIAEQLGIAQTTVNYRKEQIIGKLKKMIGS
jgi:RNA polymerase sigma factor (sigma-70 family)